MFRGRIALKPRIGLWSISHGPCNREVVEFPSGAPRLVAQISPNKTSESSRLHHCLCSGRSLTQTRSIRGPGFLLAEADLMKLFSCACLILLLSTASGFATVIITSPSSGADVTSPFSLSANASTCSSQAVVSMGYSLDNSTDTAVVSGTYLNARASAGNGPHTLHVKAWGNQGAGCVTDVAITVSGAATASVVPSDAVSTSNIESLSNWIAAYDSSNGVGTARGSMSIVSSPSQSGHARQFVTNFGNSGGERYSVSFGDDESSTNFLYDTWVYLTDTSSTIGNLEMDFNQTMANGQTALFGFQCDGYTSTWDYTRNAGSPTAPHAQWVHSSAYCNPRAWSIHTWHHVQIYYSRDESGNITYHSVWLDGAQSNINATVNSAFALGWAPALLTNLQVDGLGSGGTPIVYLDNMTITRW
jgi:hypothetical protein